MFVRKKVPGFQPEPGAFAYALCRTTYAVLVGFLYFTLKANDT